MADPVACPECGSTKTWKDGLRKTVRGEVQRYLCRLCGLRFSASEGLKSPRAYNGRCQVGAFREAKNLAEIKTSQEEKTAGVGSAVYAATQMPADVKGKIVEFLWYLKKQGYAQSTAETYVGLLNVLWKRGADLSDPESVKKAIALQESWGKGRRWNAVKAYTLFLKMHGRIWEKPRYKPVEKLPFIPTEKEIDDLIATCSKQMAAFLQVLKETGARRGEAFNLRWTDIDMANRTIRITPEKGGDPRIFSISEKLAAMLGNLPKLGEKPWIYLTIRNLEKGFRRQRRRAAHKLGNPRILQIHFHTLRHWKATIEYAKTKDILYVQKLLGHRSLKTTLRYTQLVNLPHTEEYICKVARTVEEAKELIEAGFDYVTNFDGCQLFRKRKTSYLGSPSLQMGTSSSLDITVDGDVSRNSPYFLLGYVMLVAQL
jgi:integrase